MEIETLNMYILWVYLQSRCIVLPKNELPNILHSSQYHQNSHLVLEEMGINHHQTCTDKVCDIRSNCGFPPGLHWQHVNNSLHKT